VVRSILVLLVPRKDTLTRAMSTISTAVTTAAGG